MTWLKPYFCVWPARLSGRRRTKPCENIGSKCAAPLHAIGTCKQPAVFHSCVITFFYSPRYVDRVKGFATKFFYINMRGKIFPSFNVRLQIKNILCIFVWVYLRILVILSARPIAWVKLDNVMIRDT